MRIVPLQDTDAEEAFGGKAITLGTALRAGLSVPGGWALDVALVDGISRSGHAPAFFEVFTREIGRAAVAVRSSAVGEDSAQASFAGQHTTRLNVVGHEAIVEAIGEVWASGRTASALAYRRRLGLAPQPRVAVVVQHMVVPDCAGVLFTRDPVSGEDVRVIEATWGLGEAVVAGLVTPDRWRLRRGGEVLEHQLGEKDVEIVPVDGGTAEREVDPARMAAACLGPLQLAALEALAIRCERHFEGPSDIEWAFERGSLFLLQRRAVTR